VWWSAAHFEEFEEVLALAAEGVGVAIVPSFLLAGRKDVRAVEWSRPPADNTVFAVRRTGAPQHRVVEQVLTSLRRA